MIGGAHCPTCGEETGCVAGNCDRCNRLSNDRGQDAFDGTRHRVTVCEDIKAHLDRALRPMLGARIVPETIERMANAAQVVLHSFPDRFVCGHILNPGSDLGVQIQVPVWDPSTVIVTLVGHTPHGREVCSSVRQESQVMSPDQPTWPESVPNQQPAQAQPWWKQ